MNAEEITKQIQDRIDELRPSVDEYTELETILQSLKDPNRARRFPRRQDKPKPTGAKRSGAGRPAGTGSTQARVLAVLQEKPGATLNEVAEGVGIKPNYLYRALPKLEQQGLVRSEGEGPARCWFPVA